MQRRAPTAPPKRRTVTRRGAREILLEGRGAEDPRRVLGELRTTMNPELFVDVAAMGVHSRLGYMQFAGDLARASAQKQKTHDFKLAPRQLAQAGAFRGAMLSSRSHESPGHES